jgi:uncharacterized protein YceH (UPF0502 family)
MLCGEPRVEAGRGSVSAGFSGEFPAEFPGVRTGLEARVERLEQEVAALRAMLDERGGQAD